MDKNKDISQQTDYISTDVLNRMSLTLDCDSTFDKGDIVLKADLNPVLGCQSSQISGAARCNASFGNKFTI